MLWMIDAPTPPAMGGQKADGHERRSNKQSHPPPSIGPRPRAGVSVVDPAVFVVVATMVVALYRGETSGVLSFKAIGHGDRHELIDADD